jgi:hypothetical protein
MKTARPWRGVARRKNADSTAPSSILEEEPTNEEEGDSFFREQGLLNRSTFQFRHINPRVTVGQILKLGPEAEAEATSMAPTELMQSRL